MILQKAPPLTSGFKLVGRRIHERRGKMSLYCGIDLHSTNCYLAVLDEQLRPVLGRRVANVFEGDTWAWGCVLTSPVPGRTLTV
jgi:hypothetical protein